LLNKYTSVHFLTTINTSEKRIDPMEPRRQQQHFPASTEFTQQQEQKKYQLSNIEKSLGVVIEEELKREPQLLDPANNQEVINRLLNLPLVKKLYYVISLIQYMSKNILMHKFI
jgi:hypothetical protein